MDKPLGEILREKRARALGPVEERTRKREEWLRRIDLFFNQITGWLKPLEEAGLLKGIARSPHPMEEPLLGRYAAEKMRITFYNDQFVELESLAPLGKLNPGEEATHVETWELFDTLDVLPMEVQQSLMK